MGLKQVTTSTVSTSTAKVTLTGIDSDDVYIFAWSGVTCSNDVQQDMIRITKSGTDDTTANYDAASKLMYASSSFFNNSQPNLTGNSALYQGTGTNESNNGFAYLFDFNSSTDYSYVIREDVSNSYVPQLQGNHGGFAHTVASASDGISFFMAVGTLESGTFTLYKVTDD